MPHKHYAIQISISLKSKIIITKENGEELEFNNFLIKSNITHQLSCGEQHLLLLFYPTSSIGHYLNQLSNNGITEYNHPIFEQLKICSINFLEKRIDFKRTVFEIRCLLSAFNCECENENHYKDNRIKEVIEYLENNINRIISVKEISERAHLSESRFLHLFKENTGITYRKVQQWNRISKSFSHLKKQSLAETAFQFGFTDSAHYSKVFKQTFGFNPKLIQKS